MNVNPYHVERIGKNLLDNWYFGKVINQRGQTQYTSTNDQYTIDRWLYRSQGGYNLVVHDNYIEVHDVFTQKTEMAIVPGVYTFSVLYNDGTLDTITGTVPETNYFSGNMNGANVQFGKSGTKYFVLVNYVGKNVSLKAVKFECGDHQTLAYQDAAGKWQLYEKPDYGQELERCQRYYWKSEMLYSGGAFIEGYIPSNVVFPVKMRAIPTVTVVSSKGTPNRLSYFVNGEDAEGDVFVNPPNLTDEGIGAISGVSVHVNNYYMYKIIADANL